MNSGWLKYGTVDPAKNGPFCPVLTLSGKWVLSIFYVSALFSSYKPLKFENYFYPVVFLCGVYCTSKECSLLSIWLDTVKISCTARSLELIDATVKCLKNSGRILWRVKSAVWPSVLWTWNTGRGGANVVVSVVIGCLEGAEPVTNCWWWGHRSKTYRSSMTLVHTVLGVTACVLKVRWYFIFFCLVRLPSARRKASWYKRVIKN